MAVLPSESGLLPIQKLTPAWEEIRTVSPRLALKAVSGRMGMRVPRASRATAPRGRVSFRPGSSGWLGRFRPRPGHVLTQAQPSASARAVEAAGKHLLDRLEAGPNLARLLDSKRAAHAARLTDYGMAQLGELVAKVEDGESLLAAAYALLVARQQRIDLPYLG